MSDLQRMKQSLKFGKMCCGPNHEKADYYAFMSEFYRLTAEQQVVVIVFAESFMQEQSHE